MFNELKEKQILELLKAVIDQSPEYKYVGTCPGPGSKKCKGCILAGLCRAYLRAA
jgi:hypothetical protein